MKTRAITALFFVAAMLASVLCGPYVFTAFYLLLATACLYEFYTMFDQQPASPAKGLGIGLGFVGFAILINHIWLLFEPSLLPLLGVLAPIVFLNQLFKTDKNPFHGVALTLLGWLYVIVPFYCFFLLAFVHDSFAWQLPMGFLFMLWANDTGAYLTGRAFGKHKLFERISPKKTWEGFVGGILSAVLVALSLANYTEVLEIWQWIVCGILIGVVGTLGDLTESMLKRSLNVKDSGKLLPGHGGLLDRFDGLLLAAPVVYLFLHFSA